MKKALNATLTALLLSISSFTFAQNCNCEVEKNEVTLKEIISSPLEYGELEIKFGGWSKHVDKYHSDNYNYNETHNGFGLEYFLTLDKTSPHKFGGGFWTMKDSHKETAYNIGAIYKYDTNTGYNIIDMFDFNLSFYYMERSQREYDIDTGDTLILEKIHDFVIHPYITFKPSKILSVDIMYVPNADKSYHPQTIFLRGSLNTNKLIELFN